jgi:hypothetical protein
MIVQTSDNGMIVIQPVIIFLESSELAARGFRTKQTRGGRFTQGWNELNLP